MPGVKLYTVHYIDGQNGKNGVTYRKYGGFTLEATHYPDSPNKVKVPTSTKAYFTRKQNGVKRLLNILLDIQWGNIHVYSIEHLV